MNPSSILPLRETQAPLFIPFAHIENSDDGVVTKKIGKLGKRFICDRVEYINPTGLAEHASNWALVLLQKSLVFADLAASSVSTSADSMTFTSKHELYTGDGPMRLTTTGGAPAGLAVATDYYLVRVDDYTIKFSTTRANALVGTVINITTVGTGVHTIVDTATSKRVVAYWSTDADIAGTNTIAADTPFDLTLNHSGARVVETSETLEITTDEAGTTTLPEGFGHIEGRLLAA